VSLHVLEVQPRDVAAEALGLLLDGPVPPTLASRELSDGRGNTLQLGVLGASHVVCATLRGERLTEQVSCDALTAGGERLPAAKRRAGYALATSTTEVAAEELAALAARLRATSGESDAWVCGAFPGSESALTALTGRASAGGGWAWETWHLYPGAPRGAAHGVVVRTTSRWTS
jgi:hypothetical protein